MIHDPEVQKWYFHMAKDGWEKFRYTDTMRDYNMIIREFTKHYEQTPVTQRYTRAKILSGIKRAQRYLAETIEEYEEFKQYKQRNAISQ
jgi:N-glycosylase/DNA lyase